MSLVPAKELGANYDPAECVLTLSACGEVDHRVRGIHFKRDPLWVGGLRFFLLGHRHVGIGPAVMEQYSVDQQFIIADLKRVVPSESGEIVIVTFNHPNGLLVPVYWEELDDTKPTKPGSSPTSQLKAAPAATDAAQISSSNGIKKKVFVGEKFPIKEILPHSSSGILDVDFDPHSLQLENAEAKQGSLHWYFKATEAGVSQVIVDLIPSLPEPGKLGLALVRTVYIIEAEWPVNDSGLQGKNDTLSGSLSAPLKTGEILSFLGFVFETLRIVQEAKPDLGPELFYVDATNPVCSHTTNPLDLSALFCLFGTKEGSATIRSKEWGEWKKPCFVSGEFPPLGSRPLRLDGLQDIVPAAKAMKKAGYGQSFTKARLSHIDGDFWDPEMQPFYFFTLVDGPIVRVGAVDLVVIP